MIATLQPCNLATFQIIATMAYQMALQLQQQQQKQLTQQPNILPQVQLRQRSPVSAAVASLCTAGEFTTPRTPRQQSSGASPQVATPRSEKKAKSVDHTMGVLRSGKAYSPCGKGSDVEKRRLSLSSEKEFPAAKRRDPGQHAVLVRSLSSH